MFETQLYAIHNSPWVDLFGLHYTLDRPAVRARYLESVFGSIVVFVLAVAVFWGSRWANPMSTDGKTRGRRITITCRRTVIAAAYATIALGVVVSIQENFRAVSALVGTSSVLIGGLLLIPIGTGIGFCYGGGLQLGLNSQQRSRPGFGAVAGCLSGVFVWIGGVAVGVPIWFWLRSVHSVPLPFFHVESLIGLCIYGLVFGTMYSLLCNEPG
ncbi:hypothetical protein [Natrarchaeobius chitinivorans]|uniref:hypothetical protein n=1 Tax=Natrarchaeobius chitinivorans TaxID=1679083 RepID=UPI000F5307A9|nr:hypothetical protein [Natrarchaeobius chitinivorans]